MRGFGMSLAKVAECFDAYVCTKEALGSKKLSKSEMAKATVKLINRGLEEISGVKGLTISYSKYEENIVALHKVTIEGWPEDVPRVLPQSLSKVDDVKDLYDAWSEGQAAWRKLTSKEIRELKTQRESLAGRIKQTKSSQRSGVKRKRARDEEGDDDDDAASVADDDEQREKSGNKKKLAGGKSNKRRRVENEYAGPSQKLARKGSDKSKVKKTKAAPNTSKSGGGEKEAESSGNARASKARKVKGKGLMLLDGIEDENEGASDAYVDDD